MLDNLATTIKQERKKGVRVGKEKKQSLFADDLIVYIENLKELKNKTKNLFGLYPARLQDIR